MNYQTLSCCHRIFSLTKSSSTSLFRILFCCLIIFLTIKTNQAAKLLNTEIIDCDVKNNEKFDQDMAKLLTIGEYGRNYPENNLQLKSYCEESHRIASRVEQYKNKCFRGEWKQFVSIFLYSNRNAAKQFCQKNNRRLKELLKSAQCVNSNKKRLNRCMGNLVDNMIGIKYAPDKKKVPFLCCEYIKFIDCFRETFEKNADCKNKIDVSLDFMRSIMGNVINTSCGEYNEDTDKCQKIGDVPKKKSNDNKTMKTFLYPIFDVLNSLPEK